MANKECEYCAFYQYNEYFDTYECMVNLDEDDMERFMKSSVNNCSYFRLNDDYKMVEKQN